MKIKDLMTQPARACTLDTDLTTVAGLMWTNNCGSIPVLDREEKVVGMITDRDICMATAMNHRNPDRLRVADVNRTRVYSVSPEDKDTEALETMKKYHVHRLPVVDPEGRLQGVVSITDFVRATPTDGQLGKDGIRDDLVVDALIGIRGRHKPRKRTN